MCCCNSYIASNVLLDLWRNFLAATTLLMFQLTCRLQLGMLDVPKSICISCVQAGDARLHPAAWFHSPVEKAFLGTLVWTDFSHTKISLFKYKWSLNVPCSVDGVQCAPVCSCCRQWRWGWPAVHLGWSGCSQEEVVSFYSPLGLGNSVLPLRKIK